MSNFEYVLIKKDENRKFKLSEVHFQVRVKPLNEKKSHNLQDIHLRKGLLKILNRLQNE